MLLDKLKVLTGDVIKVLLHLSKGLLVVVHQLVDVLVFALFDLVDFDFHSEVELSLKTLQLKLVALDQRRLLEVELLLQVLDLGLEVGLLFLNLSNVGFLVNGVGFLALGF